MKQSNELKPVAKENTAAQPVAAKVNVPWSPWLAVILVVVVYFVSQYIGELVISIYPLLRHWSEARANTWVSNSIIAQFVYVLIAEAFTVGSIYLFIRHYKSSFGSIALHKPRWRDPVYGILAAPVYYVLYLLTVGVVSSLVHINTGQQQDIGFTNVHGIAQLTLTFISLAILPPITEEIMVRGFLYGSLKKGMPQVAAVLVTSAIFASAHLPEGGAAGPLWIAALDTFVLSLVLIYLREKTQNLWASMTLHTIKNSVAFIALFIINTR